MNAAADPVQELTGPQTDSLDAALVKTLTGILRTTRDAYGLSSISALLALQEVAMEMVIAVDPVAGQAWIDAVASILAARSDPNRRNASLSIQHHLHARRRSAAALFAAIDAMAAGPAPTAMQ